MYSDPKQLSIESFDYVLPDESIAKYPLEQRDESKLLINDKGSYTITQYKYLSDYLPTDTVLIFNDTKVIAARLLFKKATGRTIELFCLEPDNRYASIEIAMLKKERVVWKCLVGGAKKWKEDALELAIPYQDCTIHLVARKHLQISDYYLIEFTWDAPLLSFAEILHIAGLIPLPPYLNRQAEEGDKATYQTVYAAHEGSVAAPTAGLHFTTNQLQQLTAKGIDQKFVTLHVGAGTFKPVKAATMAEHDMHAEWIDVSIDFINAIAANPSKTVIAVGTTSLRTIESLYWMGVKAKLNPSIDKNAIKVSQWEAYQLAENSCTMAKAFEALGNWMESNKMHRLITQTSIIIAPGYTLKVAKGIITNFHQPKSTLLLLIAAIIGNDWKRMYAYALSNQFRFLSYGDGSLLWQQEVR